MALQEGGSESVSDIASWLKTNNLEPLIQIFQDRSITLEELCEIVEFGDEELTNFAKELSNDTNIQQNLVKAAKTIKIKPLQNDNNMAEPDMIAAPASISSNNPYPTPQRYSQQHVIVSPAEHEAISALYQRYDFVSNLRTEIQKHQEPLTLNTETAIKTIEDLFDNILIPQIKNKKNKLLHIIDELSTKKEQQLKQQLISIQEYVQIVDKGKNRYDAYIDDGTLDINSRKQAIVNMTNEIMNHSAAYNAFITAPQIKFNDYSKDLNAYYNTLIIDDCDQPRPPIVRIVKIGFSSVNIEWKMKDIDINGAKPVLQFEIEYAALPKSFRKKIKLKDALKMERKKAKKMDKRKKKKKKKKKKKRKKKKDIKRKKRKKKKGKYTSKNAEDSSDTESDTESESDTDSSDSDSSSNSDTDSDTDTDDSNSDYDDDDDDDDDDDKKRNLNEDDDGDNDNEYGFDEDMIDLQTLKWIKNEKKFKVKPRALKKNKFKYIFETLKDEYPYIIRLRGRNESGWGKYCKILKFQTNKLVIDSKILDNKGKIQLMKWVPSGKKRRWRLIFRGSKHGFAAYQFHSKCDGKGPTVVIIQSSIGNIFGGYTALPWSSSGNYKFDPEAFVFILKSKQRKHQKPTKWGVKGTNKNSVYHNSSYGATFGGGHDLYLCNNCNSSSGSYSSLGNSYQAPNDNNLLAGTYNFMVTDYEVFQLTKK